AQTPAVDHVLELLPYLPVGSDRCVVMRPSLLSVSQRALYLPMSQSEARPFWPELDVAAYAEGARERRDGRPFQVSLFWLEAGEAETRAVLERQLGARVAWDDAASECGALGCPARARFEVPHVLRLERGSEAAGSSPGAEAHCRELARQHPHALELTYSR